MTSLSFEMCSIVAFSRAADHQDRTVSLVDDSMSEFHEVFRRPPLGSAITAAVVEDHDTLFGVETEFPPDTVNASAISIRQRQLNLT